MRKLILAIIFGIAGFTGFSQSLERMVIASAGSAVSNSETVFSFTIGEVSTESATAVSGTATLTQGFQQAEAEDFVGIIEVDEPLGNATVFPNPTVDILQIESTVPGIGVKDLEYQIIDLQGRIVMEGNAGSVGGQIDVRMLAASSYTLVLVARNKQFVQRVKFSKV